MKSLYMILVATCIIGCSKQPQIVPTEPTAGAARKLQELPMTVTVKQRSTTTVPGSEDELMVTIDDVTRGQVMVSLAEKDGSPILGPVSMKEDDSALFQFDQASYSIRVNELANALVGDDFASFVIDAASPGSLTEDEKIEKLIADVGKLEGAVFIRNGEEHPAEEAADHLRKKLTVAGDQVNTASEFIDRIASKSSLSGEEYKIRMPDGRIVTAREYLTQQLEKLQDGS